MDCPHCGSMRTRKYGKSTSTRRLPTQRYLCKRCGRYFSETTAKRTAIVILVPRPAAANLFYELKTFLAGHPDIRLRKGDVTIKELRGRSRRHRK